MKVERIMNSPEVETDEKGIKTLIPNSIENLESSVDSENVILTPVERQAIKDAQRNRKHISEVFTELAERAVTMPQDNDADTKVKVENMYTKVAPIKESMQGKRRRLTLEQFMSYHRTNKMKLCEGRTSDDDRSEIDSEKNVYNIVRDRLLWDSNNEIVKELPIPQSMVRGLYKRDVISDNYYTLSKPGTRYNENSLIVRAKRFNMNDWDVAVIVPTKEDAKLAEDIAKFFNLKFELIELTDRQAKDYPVLEKKQTVYPAKYVAVIKMTKNEAQSNLAYWAYSQRLQDKIPVKYLKNALKELSPEEQEFLSADLGIATKKSRLKKKSDKD